MMDSMHDLYGELEALNVPDDFLREPKAKPGKDGQLVSLLDDDEESPTRVIPAAEESSEVQTFPKRPSSSIKPHWHYSKYTSSSVKQDFSQLPKDTVTSSTHSSTASTLTCIDKPQFVAWEDTITGACKSSNKNASLSTQPIAEPTIDYHGLMGTRKRDSDGWQTFSAAEVGTVFPQGISLDHPNNASILALQDLSFLQDVDPGNCTLRVFVAMENVFSIHGLDQHILASHSPTLTKTMNNGYIDIHDSTPASVVGLIRAFYQDDYTFCEAMLDRPISLLLHLQILKLAQRYQVTSVETLAYGHIQREMNDALTQKRGVVDLCSAIRFVYIEMTADIHLRETLCDYTVQNFTPHIRSEEEAFRQTAFESPSFHADLCHANSKSNFSSEHAGTIIQLPVCGHSIHKDVRGEGGGIFASGAVNDFTCRLHLDLAEYASAVSSPVMRPTVGSGVGKGKERAMELPFGPFVKPVVGPRRRLPSYTVKPPSSVGSSCGAVMDDEGLSSDGGWEVVSAEESDSEWTKL